MYPTSGPTQQRRGGGNQIVTSVPQMRAPNNISMNSNTSRIPEMLDQVKGEFEGMVQQLGINKMERDDFERKLQAQLQEMEQMQQTFKSLEANHRRARQSYEEELMRMRRQSESQGMQQPKSSNKRRPMDDMVSRNPQSSHVTSPARVSPAPQRQQQPNPQQMQAQAHPSSQQRMPSVSAGPQPPRAPVSQPMQQLSSGGSSAGGPPTSGPQLSQVHTSQPMQSMPSSSQVGRQDIPTSQVPSLPSADTLAGANASLKRESPKDSANGSMDNGDSSNLPALKKIKPNGTDGHSQDNRNKSEYKGDRLDSVQSSVSHGVASSTQAASSQSSMAPTSNSGEDSHPNSNSAKSKVKWTISYNTKSSSYPETDRPHVEMRHTLDHQSVVCCVRFSSDGTKMASGCHKTAQVFDVKTGQQVFSVTRPLLQNAKEGEDAYVRAVCFSPCGTKLVAGMPQNNIRMWDINTKQEGLNLTGHESEIYSLDYVKNLVASGSGDRKVRLWNASSGVCQAVFGSESSGPNDGVTSVALSPDGRLLAAASLDKIVRIWDTTTTQLVDRLEGHNDSVYSIAFSPDGKNVISGSLDRTLMLWDVTASGRTTSRPRLLFQGHKDFVLSVAYTPDGRWLMSGSKDRTVVFWDPRSTRAELTLSGYRNSVISVASSPASPHFATGSGDSFACIWKYERQTI